MYFGGIKMKNLEFKLIKLSDNLKKYINAEKLSHSELADAYLEISRGTYGLLAQYPSDWKELKKGYPELLKILNIIQYKQSSLIDKSGTLRNDRNAIKYNKDQTSKDINLCISLMLELRGTRIRIFNISLSIFTLVIAGVSLFTQFLSKP